jgi:SAM-dependent MidA family methyltransferase
VTGGLGSRLVDEVRQRGPLRFDRYVERCLYDPEDGFYTAGAGAAGRRRDFLTSPEVGPLFGAVLARLLDRWWHDAGRPRPWVVVDAGAGPGTLLRSLLLAAPECSAAWRLVAVERSPALRAGYRDLADRGVVVTDGLPELGGAVVIANELLDNLAFRVLERDGGGWSDLAVTARGATLALTTVATPTPDARAASDLAPGAEVGHRIPWLAEARRWVAEVLAGGPSHLLVLDYGCLRTAEQAQRPWTEWTRTYRGHGSAGSPLDAPGTADVTVELVADQLPGRARWTTQRQLLADAGIDELVDDGRRTWAERAGVGDLAALRARSRVREAEALTDPEGLGAWLVGHWTGGRPRPPLG